jgi:hypothetical protein
VGDKIEKRLPERGYLFRKNILQLDHYGPKREMLKEKRPVMRSTTGREDYLNRLGIN